MKNHELITVKEAKELTGFSEREFYYAVHCRKLKRFGDGWKVLLDKNEILCYAEEKRDESEILLPFGNITLDFDESLKLMDGLHCPNYIVKPGVYMMKKKYGISNTGNIYNLTENFKLAQFLGTNGYMQVSLTAKDTISESVHVLVAIHWCPNRKFKREVHHIDGDRLNNRKENLVWATKSEHTNAHRLLKEAKDTADYSEYKQYIEKIEEDNRWDREYRCLVFEKEFEGFKGAIFCWITKDAYGDYQNGIRSLDEIYWNEELTHRVVWWESLEVMDAVLKKENETT